MNKIEICKKIKNVTRKILLKDGDNYISSGTGVFVNEEGYMLTANHVIGQYKNLKQPIIIVNSVDSEGRLEQLLFTPHFFDVSLDVGTPEVVRPIGIDLAIIKPVKEIKILDFIELENDIPKIGEDCLIAGFPDEINLVLDFQDNLNYEENTELVDQYQEIQNHLKFSMSLMLIKSGMIGAVHEIKIGNKETAINGASYWIDNASTFGASGGPMVNSKGKLLGIVCQKGLTSFNGKAKVLPSGSTMALSHKLITWKLSK